MPTDAPETFDAWHPGVASGIPEAWRDLETLYRPDCASSGRAEVDADVTLTGLAPEQLTAFRPARLALHELIVRITAEIAVPEGDIEEDVGKHFRHIALRVRDHYLAPEMARIEAAHAAFCARAEATIGELLHAQLGPPPPPPRRRLSLAALFGRRPNAAAATPAVPPGKPAPLPCPPDCDCMRPDRPDMSWSISAVRSSFVMSVLWFKCR